MSSIWFCKANQPYYEFSNFYPCNFIYNNKTWKSTEHAYQAMKFENELDQEHIRSQPNAFMAAREGRDRSRIIRPQWDKIHKENVMHDTNWCKYAQNKPLLDLLLSTDNRELVELSFKDNYWGSKPDRSGLNRLGIRLMHLRLIFKTLS